MRTFFRRDIPSLATAVIVGVFASWVVAYAVNPIIAPVPPLSVPPSAPASGLSASPASGVAPLNNVSLTVVTSGATGDTFNYKFQCNNTSGSYDKTVNSTSQTTYTATNLCNYSAAGTFTAYVDIVRFHTSNGSTSQSNYGYTATITVTAAPPPPQPGPPPPPPAPINWRNPTANPPGANAPQPVDVSNAAQSKSGALTVGGNFTVNGLLNMGQSLTAGNMALNSANAFANALLIPYGKVGIGTNSPTLPLDVSGGARVTGGLTVAGNSQVWGGLQTLAVNTFYTAPSDGLVMASMHYVNNGDRCYITGDVADSGLLIGDSVHYYPSGNTYVPYGSITFPVRKGHSWKVTLTNTSGSCAPTVLYIPFGG